MEPPAAAPPPGSRALTASPLTHNPTGPAMVAMSHQAGRSGSVAAGASGSRGPPSARWSRWPAQAATMTPSTTRPRCGPIAAASAPASSPPERARGCSRSRSAGGANRRYQPTSNSATPRATSTSAERTSAPDGAAATRPRPPQPSSIPPGVSAMAPAIVGAERRSSTRDQRRADGQDGAEHHERRVGREEAGGQPGQRRGAGLGERRRRPGQPREPRAPKRSRPGPPRDERATAAGGPRPAV